MMTWRWDANTIMLDTLYTRTSEKQNSHEHLLIPLTLQKLISLKVTSAIFNPKKCLIMNFCSLWICVPKPVLNNGFVLLELLLPEDLSRFSQKCHSPILHCCSPPPSSSWGASQVVPCW